jgi:hypothetical protein
MAISIYLDHKDYANIAKAVRGDAQHEGDLHAYRNLRALISDGQVACYYSSLHFVEAIRSNDSTWLTLYSKIVDDLTQGNCIVHHEELERRELSHFLARRFAVHSNHSIQDAFGRGCEALTDPEVIVGGALSTYRASLQHQIKEHVRGEQLNRTQRRLLVKNFPKLLQTLDLGTLPLTEPDTSRLPPPLVEMLRDPAVFHDFVRGSVATRKQLLLRVLERGTQFSSVLPFYTAFYPDLAEIGSAFDDGARGLMAAIMRHRDWHDTFVTHGYAFDLGAIRSRLVHRVSKHLARLIWVVNPRCRVRRRDVEAALIENDLRDIPSWDAAVSLWIEYLRANIGTSDRTLQESDLRDILHFRHAPYVNYLVTDRYFASLGRALGQRFSTVILRNIRELVSRIENDLCAKAR